MITTGDYESFPLFDFENCYYLKEITFLYPELAELGEGVGFNEGCWINAAGGLRIGAGTLFGPRCLIHTANHKGEGWEHRAVTVGSGVWVGAGAIIVPGAAIGDNAVVAAGAVVVGAVPANSLVAGNPAKVKR